jgi:hypothetical protein
MTKIFARHNVEDFDRWREIFEGEFSVGVRQAGGMIDTTIYRSVDDPNDVTVVQTFRTVEAAKSYLRLSGLNDRMAAAGVLGRPSIWIVDEV